MTENRKRGPILVHLEELESRCKKGDPTFREIFDIFGPEGHFVLTLFLVLPFLQPIPFPGLSTLFGLLIAVVACFFYVQKPTWLPKRVAEKKLSAQTVLKIAEGSEKVFEKLAFFKPRLQFFLGEPFRIVNVVLLVANAILLALPLPVPFSNAIPAWTIAFLTFAYLEDDGAMILLSYIGSTACFGFFGVLFVKTAGLF